MLTRGRPELLPETAPPVAPHDPFQQASTDPDDGVQLAVKPRPSFEVRPGDPMPGGPGAGGGAGGKPLKLNIGAGLLLLLQQGARVLAPGLFLSETLRSRIEQLENRRKMLGRLPKAHDFRKADADKLIWLDPGDVAKLGRPIIVTRNETQETKDQIDNVAKRTLTAGKDCKNGDWEHEKGGRHLSGEEKGTDQKEQFLSPKHRSGARERIDGQRKGSSFVDLTFKHGRSGRRLHINTYDPRNLRGDLTKRELAAAVRIVYNAAKGDVLVLIPKLKKKQAIDLDELQNRLRNIMCDMDKDPPEIDPRDAISPRRLINIFKGRRYKD